MGDGSSLTAERLADATGDPGIGRVTQVKSARAGLATLLTGAPGAFVANGPAPILALLPTEADCRDYVVSDVEPGLEATPALRGLLAADTEGENRNTLISRRFLGGSMKAIAARPHQSRLLRTRASPPSVSAAPGPLRGSGARRGRS